MAFHVPNEARVRKGAFGSDDSVGNNGAFTFKVGSQQCFAIASDGGIDGGPRWEHVSISFASGEKTPSWDVMCAVKNYFWDEEDCVVQYHPPKSEYVNHHPGTLHLWRPIDETMPRPPSFMVGPPGDSSKTDEIKPSEPSRLILPARYK